MRVASPKYARLPETQEFADSTRRVKLAPEPVDTGPSSTCDDNQKQSKDFDLKKVRLNALDGACLGARVGCAISLVGIPFLVVDEVNRKRRLTGAEPIKKIPTPIALLLFPIVPPMLVGLMAGALVGGAIGGIGSSIRKVVNLLPKKNVEPDTL